MVGGASTRMGQPKGLLRSPDRAEPLLIRAVHVVESAGMRPVLVGEMSPYRSLNLGLPEIQDRPAGVGPIGGILGLLHCTAAPCIVWACDMPYVTAAMLRRLGEATPTAKVLCAHTDRWQPLLSRWCPSVAADVDAYVTQGGRSLRGALRHVQAEALPFADDLVRDWDCPSDVPVTPTT